MEDSGVPSRLQPPIFALPFPAVDSFEKDIAVIDGTPAVSGILDLVCRSTGMGFAAVARVTEDRWIACSVRDEIRLGLKAGDDLEVQTTPCHVTRRDRKAIIIDHAGEDGTFSGHGSRRIHGFQSYVSMPILLGDGQFFGTLCAIDPKPARLNTPETLGMFKLFAELIALHIDASGKLAAMKGLLDVEREISALRERVMAVLGHDLRNPLGAISLGAILLKEKAADERSLDLLSMIEKSVSRITGLIDDVTDFARIRPGEGIKLDLRSDTGIEKILGRAIDEARSLWPGRRVESDFAVTEELVFDGRRIARLFTHLLAHAMKHGKPETPVRVRAESAAGRFVLSVANEAEPVPPEVMGRMFQPVVHVDGDAAPRAVGWGLYIASEIARGHGGTLEVVPAGKELRFVFSMPVKGGRPSHPPGEGSR